MQDSKRSIVAWALYDWANSAFATTVMAGFFPVFFTAYWAVGASSEQGTFYLGFANSLGSLIVALLAPFLGAIADWGSYKKRLLAFFALLGSVMTASLFILSSGSWPLAVLFYSLGVVGFSGANTFYDALLPFVASEKKVDFVSSLGYSLGYIGGGLLFLVNVLMFLNPSWFGIASQESAIKISFVIVGIWWVAFTIPLLVLVKEEQREKTLSLRQSISKGLHVTTETIRSFRKLKTIALFLAAYWLYIDGVDTIIRMAVNYGSSLNFPSDSLIIALLITQFVAFPAALGYSAFGKRIGVRQALMVAIAAYIIIAILGFFMTKVLHFYLLAICIGLFQGGIQALSRSYYTRLIPKERSAEFFGFFNMLGKFAAIIGPALMGIVTLITGSTRMGILSLILLFVGGFLLLRLVNEEKGQAEAEAYLQIK
ncbi:MAG: MFS transporter [Sphaerochaeta sp.]|uniref:MFS transporter n=1 Tax=Sphaerochaeta sp. TaxID=1972642 RepID=UPI001DF4B468|nr:MFS transporter [Sphaerochaeta sp.]MDD3930140.1 MFS transporter [Sphaerochaeta sp.]NCC11968.1 MFS transporter [Spirochaetia bacterium]NCC89481.1 MFS transporter [Spirochaetia bacterium]